MEKENLSPGKVQNQERAGLWLNTSNSERGGGGCLQFWKLAESSLFLHFKSFRLEALLPYIITQLNFLNGFSHYLLSDENI